MGTAKASLVKGTVMPLRGEPFTSNLRLGGRLAGAILLVGLSVAIATCSGGGDGEDQAAQDTLTRRQKDSIIATLPVPGAGAVGKALDAADAAKARAERLDTIG